MKKTIATLKTVSIPPYLRRTLAMIVIMLATVANAGAQTLINGIYYTLDSSSLTAKVVKGSTSYSGDVTIPATVTYGGKVYTVTTISNSTFYNCSQLLTVKIPATVNTIEPRAFYNGCKKLSAITVDANNDWFTDIDGVLYTKDMKKLVRCPMATSGLFNIPDGVEEICASGFMYCFSLTEITIPNSVIKIEVDAFTYCNNLKNLYCLAKEPPSLYYNTFYGVDKSIPVYVPASSIEAYKAADYWSEFTNFQAIAEPAKTEWRISDRTDIEVDFHSINEAMADERVQDGHTLYIERGTNLTDATITKKVTIVGPGYDLADDSRNAKVDFLIINSENTKVVGLQIQNALVCNNNVNIENCYITNSVLGNETSYENDNCVIKSCFIAGNVYGRGEDGTYEWTLTNNIIRGKISDFEEMTLNHNTIVNGDYALYNVNGSTITNNVLFNSVLSSAPVNNCLDNQYAKNIVSNTCNTGDEFKCETLEKIITCTGNASSEDYYSPTGYALAYSTDGTDCGAFGGSNPYVKGGKSGLFVEREGEEKPEPEPEPTYPETPIAKGQLDKNAILDIENDVYNSLGEFLKALSIRSIMPGTEIAVENQQFDIALDDKSYGYIQTSAVALELAKAYIYMKASNNAVFNITLSPAFAAAHATEVQTVVATIIGFANHIVTTNIKILINGTLYQYIGFQVDPNDLLDLKNMYNAMGGDNWTRKWSFLSNGRQASDFPGVTFATADEMGYSRVQEINLDKNNLSGKISSLALNFPLLTTLSLYGNSLTGNATEMVRGLSSLKSLNISYNLLTGLTSLPSSVTSLSKGGQLTGASSEYLAGLSPLAFYISEKQKVKLPSIMTYDLPTNSNLAATMYIMERGNTYAKDYYGTLQAYDKNMFTYYTSWVNNPYVYDYEQQHAVFLRSSDGTIYPATIEYVVGDANMSGYTDLLDVQTTISKVLSPSVVYLFNKSAANTFSDNVINVQDVVCTVNIVLGKATVSIETPAETGNHDQPVLLSRHTADNAGTNTLYVSDERLWIDNSAEVAAIELDLRGVSSDEVSLALNRNDFQMASRNTDSGSRHIIYSLTGKTVPTGTTALLRLSHNYGEVADAALSSLDAKALNVTIGVTPTAIQSVESGSKVGARFDGDGIVITSSREISNAEVVVTTTSGINTAIWKGDRLEAGETTINHRLTSGIYIIGIYENGKRISNNKVVKK